MISGKNDQFAIHRINTPDFAQTNTRSQLLAIYRPSETDTDNLQAHLVIAIVP